MEKCVALIAGASGIVGRAMLQHLEDLPHWRAIGVSRRLPDLRTRARLVSLDLLDSAECERVLCGLTDVTHLFYTAFNQLESLSGEVTANVSMLRNVVEVVERCAPGLEHVQLMQGSKWYGSHLGPYPTPAREDQPRHPMPHFYFAQQDWLSARQAGRPWTWSALRPHGVWGFAVGGQINMMLAIAIYASVLKHMGQPLLYPGKPGAFGALYQCTEASYLARGMVWAATSTRTANQSFNFTNGDFIRWRDAWPIVADWFRMPVGGVQTFDVGRFMQDKEPVWEEIRGLHNLRPYRIADLTTWSAIATNMFNADWDQMSSMTKARNAGWADVNETREMIRRQFDRLARDGVIPNPGGAGIKGA